MGKGDTERGQATREGEDRDGKRERRHRSRMGGRRQETRITRGTEKISKETLGREGNEFGDTREDMKEEIRDKGGYWERT